MSELTDAELSLAVAKIIWPECDWVFSRGRKVMCSDGGRSIFDHTTDDALGKMCVWLANECHGRDKGYSAVIPSVRLRSMLEVDNPHRAIAEAILEASND